MWDMRRWLDPKPLPQKRYHHPFHVSGAALGKRSWWLVIDGGKVDLCQTDPGFEVDLYVKSSLRTMTAVWMGMTTVKKEIAAGQMELIGDKSHRPIHAAVAGPQPLRQGESARRRDLSHWSITSGWPPK